MTRAPTQVTAVGTCARPAWRSCWHLFARQLTELPAVRTAFEAGRMSWSQARAITRVAEPDDGVDWVRLARHGSADQLELGSRHHSLVHQLGFHLVLHWADPAQLDPPAASALERSQRPTATPAWTWATPSRCCSSRQPETDVTIVPGSRRGRRPTHPTARVRRLPLRRSRVRRTNRTARRTCAAAVPD